MEVVARNRPLARDLYSGIRRGVCSLIGRANAVAIGHRGVAYVNVKALQSVRTAIRAASNTKIGDLNLHEYITSKAA